MLQRFLTSEISKLTAIFLVWRLTLFFFGFLAQTLLPKVQAGQLGFGEVNFWSAWSNWDGGHFLGISQNGFKFTQQYAFFPLLPVLIRILAPVFLGNFLAAGLFVTNISALFAVFLFFKLARLDFGKNLSLKSLIYFLFFPTAFFLGAVYAESLFLVLTLAAFYFARLGNWKISSLFVVGATLTKPYGVLVTLPLIIEYFSRKRFKLKIDQNFFLLFIPVLIFFLYLVYLKNLTGDPLIFIKVQENWQRAVANPFVTFWNYYLSFFTQEVNFFFGIKLAEFVSAILVLVVIVTGWSKLRLSYFTYILPLFLVFVSTGNLTSFTRFTLILWPIFFVIGSWGENFLFDFFYKLASLALLGLFVSLFLSGYFIA